MNRDITFDAYVKAVKQSFKKNGYSDAETEKYFSTADVKDKVKRDYEAYTTENPKDDTSGGHDPNAVAYCLDLMY